VFQNPELFPTQVSLSPEQSTYGEARVRAPVRAPFGSFAIFGKTLYYNLIISSSFFLHITIKTNYFFSGVRN
jgi:hypothetical protein